MSDELRIGLVLPEVLGTYGDSGNALVLERRAQWRGIDATVIPFSLQDEFPTSCDIYTMGGGEDTAQTLATNYLRTSAGFHKVIDRGIPILAVCASMQILGTFYRDADGTQHDGLSVLDCHTVAQRQRSIGELLTTPLIEGLSQPLTGFENHGGATIVGPQATPLATVDVGVGNADPDRNVEGVVQGSIIATYMHGPVLARNPELADYLLEKALGHSVMPLHIDEVDTLRAERLRAVTQQ